MTVSGEMPSTSAVSLHFESGEEAQLYDARLSGIDLRERVEGIIQRNQLIRAVWNE
jgi:hypothetical protein